MKTLIILLFIGISQSALAAKNIYDFSVENIDGKSVLMSEYKGKVLLIVNTASGCGYTPQYNDLEVIYQKYKSQGLVVLGFPSNDFGGQEPGTNQEIKKFCDLETGKYKISFPMFSKSNVKSEPRNPLFSFLTQGTISKFQGSIQWNFEKFVIDRNGKLVGRFLSKIKPTDAALTGLLEKELK